MKRPIASWILAGLTALTLLAAGAPPASAAPNGVFGEAEVRHEGIRPFPKWVGALARYEQEKLRYAHTCLVTKYSNCHWREWHELADSLKGQPEAQQLDAINRYMNRHPYVLDWTNWGVEDYWESPGEFFQFDGDCEDYAIAKYMSLLLLGYDDSRIRLVVLNDLNLKIPHAVLVVNSGDKAWVLDNQVAQVVDAASIHHYQPIYAVNLSGWWMYRP
ncbi:MAG TPA: transglutaminase-like cysteine peptidase [Candidatus Cybelea sp.]|nr:transglutaminase-like cysteine peptidase [Candidatus Cybelea sp.]